MPEKKILVLCVDRDNDLGEKGHVKGPVIGREKVLQAANKLGLADPQDTDFNAMFQAVRLYDEMKKSRPVEVACITGDRDVGIKSDEQVAIQLSAVLRKTSPEYALVVSDGAEDDHILPIISSKVPIISVNRVAVKQAEQLESAYFKFKDFIDRSLDDPKTALLFYGLPSILLILVGLFDSFGLKVAFFVIGVLLAIKGFKPLESYSIAAVEEFFYSLSKNRLAFFSYVVALAFLAIGTFSGYNNAIGFIQAGIFGLLAAFISKAIPFYFLGGTIAWVVRGITVNRYIVPPGKLAAVPLFGFALTFVLYNAASLVLASEFTLENFFLSIILGFIVVVFAIVLERKVKKK